MAPKNRTEFALDVKVHFRNDISAKYIDETNFVRIYWSKSITPRALRMPFCKAILQLPSQSARYRLNFYLEQCRKSITEKLRKIRRDAACSFKCFSF